MDSASYSAPEAARLLRVSIPTLKRLCQTGELACFRTPGGHLRIPADDLRNFQGKGKPNGSTTSAPLSVLVNRRERLEELSLEGQELRAQRELRKLRNEEAAEAEQRRAEAEQRQGETKRRAQTAEQDRIDRFHREAEERRRQAEVQRVADFRRRWLNVAERKADEVGWLSAQGRKLLLDALELEISKRGQADEAGMEAVLTRTVKAVVEPLQEEREGVAQRARLVQSAVHALPFGASDADRARASISARAALSGLALDATDAELRIALDDALAPTKQTIEERHTRARREQFIASAGNSLPWNSTEGERLQAQQAVRAGLENLPLAASQAEQSVVASALTPLREKVEDRTATQRQEAARQSKKSTLISLAVFDGLSYLDKLHDEGELELDRGEDFYDVRNAFEATLRNELAEELSGDESQDEADDMARRIVDEELE